MELTLGPLVAVSVSAPLPILIYCLIADLPIARLQGSFVEALFLDTMAVLIRICYKVIAAGCTVAVKLSESAPNAAAVV